MSDLVHEDSMDLFSLSSLLAPMADIQGSYFTGRTFTSPLPHSISINPITIKPMTFPNPANYYLPTPEQFETEIVGFPFLILCDFNADLSCFLSADYDTTFITSYTSQDLDDWIDKLEPIDLINLIRWVTERLAYLYHKQTSVKAAQPS